MAQYSLEQTANHIVRLQATGNTDLEILKGFAEFWKIPYQQAQNWNGPPGATISRVIHGDASVEHPLILIPSSDQARSIAKKYELQVEQERVRLRLPVSKEASVSIQTLAFKFSGPGLSSLMKSGENVVLYKLSGLNVHLLSVDIVGEYSRLMMGLEDRPHRRFLLVSRLGGSYNIIPRFIRNQAFKDPTGLEKLREETMAPIECLRAIFLACVLKTTGPVPYLSFWRKGKEHALTITHDVETRKGLENGVPRMLKVEEKAGVRSTWNVPSHRYPLSENLISRIALAGELGGHDTKHDGKLILADQNAKVRRLSDCRRRLEESSGMMVNGFRSPLLQHDTNLVQALAAAGYTHDSSVPSWEVLSPTSLGQHGIGTIFPLTLSGLIEIPVSLPQDHQMLRVMGLTMDESVKQWWKFSDWIRGIGGVSTLLVHPDYDFGDPAGLPDYERLLEKYTQDSTCDIMTLGEIAAWWKYRDSFHWSNGNEGLELKSNAKPDSMGQVQLKRALAYDEEHGFVTEDYS